MVVECNRKGLQKHTFLNGRYKINRALGTVDRVKCVIPQGFGIYQQSLRQSTALVKGVSPEHNGPQPLRSDQYT